MIQMLKFEHRHGKALLYNFGCQARALVAGPRAQVPPAQGAVRDLAHGSATRMETYIADAGDSVPRRRPCPCMMN